ncbi:HTH-type transcriptional regulator YofA [Nymphon striatum]|nr:HTH-type transcriptional regulator YofA [Nymphon striatum]
MQNKSGLKLMVSALVALGSITLASSASAYQSGMGGMSGMSGMGGMSGMSGMGGMSGMSGQPQGNWVWQQRGMSGMGGMSGMSGMGGMSGMSGMGGQRGMSGMSGMGGMSGMNGMSGMSGMGGMSGMSGMGGMSGMSGQPQGNWVWQQRGMSGMGGMSGMSGMGGMSGMSGMGGQRGMSGMSGMGGMSGMNGMSGMSGMGGMSGMSGMGGMSGMSGQPQGNWVWQQRGMSGMGGMSGMSGMSGMGGMSGMNGMSGMGGMSGMSGMSGTSGYFKILPNGEILFYPQTGMSGMSGMGGMSGMSGMGGMSGMSGQRGMSGMSGMGGMSGMNGMSGMSGMGGMSGMSGMGGMSGIIFQKAILDQSYAGASYGVLHKSDQIEGLLGQFINKFTQGMDAGTMPAALQSMTGNVGILGGCAEGAVRAVKNFANPELTNPSIVFVPHSKEPITFMPGFFDYRETIMQPLGWDAGGLTQKLKERNGLQIFFQKNGKTQKALLLGCDQTGLEETNYKVVHHSGFETAIKQNVKILQSIGSGDGASFLRYGITIAGTIWTGYMPDGTRRFSQGGKDIFHYMGLVGRTWMGSAFGGVKGRTELPEADLPLIPGVKSVSGHSMGGHGALICALKNPEGYKSASLDAPQFGFISSNSRVLRLMISHPNNTGRALPIASDQAGAIRPTGQAPAMGPIRMGYLTPISIKSLQLFMEVAETGSFVAAAKRQHTVQSNVTSHIKKLEEELGAVLFHRKGGARLTTAGRTLVDYAGRMLRDHDDVLGLFNGDKNMPSQLRLGAMETTTAVRLPSVLSSYYRQYPKVNLTVETAPTAELVAKLMDGSVDGIFIAGRPEHERFHFIKAFSEKLVLIGPKPLKQFPTSEQLLETVFIAFRQGCSYRQRIELLLSHYGVTATKIFEFGSIDGILGCVAAGMGYALMPLSTVEIHRLRYDIDYIELPSAIADLDTYFATAEPETWTPALSHFVNMIDQENGT